MHRLAPWTKRILIAWFAIWVLEFLISPLGSGGLLANAFALDLRTFFAFGSTGGWLDWMGSLAGLLGAYTLLHAHGDLFHVGINALLFYYYAPSVEQLFPGRRFLRYLWIAALAGAGANLLMHVFGARWSALGGSGLVAAVIATNAAMYPNMIINLLVIRVRMLHLFLFLLGLDLLRFVVLLKGGSGGVAFDVHLGGAAAGWLLVDGFARFGIRMPWTRAVDRWRTARSMRGQRRSQDEDAELDRILEKISREGLPSLSASEKRFLERRSEKRG